MTGEAPTVCIIGLGYVGLPTALAFARTGLHVVGMDLDEGLVASLRIGEHSVVEEGLQRWLDEVMGMGTLEVSTEVGPADVFVICVPTPMAEEGRRADLSAVEAAGRAVAGVLKEGDLVVLESTVPPGTTEGVLAPLLEASGLRGGEGFSLGYCPERVLPGNIVEELVENDRIIGGDSPATCQRLTGLYGRWAKGEIVGTDIRTAEFVKVVENTYRAVNIGLANELLLLAEAHGVDVHRAVELANRHPRVEILGPGPGVGGHCIPVDPWFLVQGTQWELSGVVQEAMDRNAGMPGIVREKVMGLLRELGKGPEGARVALLGAAYKAGTADARESPSERLYHLLTASGVEVRVYDPYVTRFVSPVERDLPALVGWCDVAVVMVDHAEVTAVDWSKTLPTGAGGPLVLDVRGILGGMSDPRIRGLGQ